MALNKKDKIKERLKDKKYIKKISEEHTKDREVINIKFLYPGQPENYIRERYTNRGKRFYNKKAKQMDNANKFYSKQLDVLTRDKLNKLIANKDAEYYIKIDIDFYLKIPNGDSIKRTILKEEKIILPGIRPDLDNYLKFTIDVLHNILFDDDKRVTSINSNKYYSINPRTEIKIEIVILNNYL
jgi:Holliday junction resolvase RusA-like endonuclease